MNLSAPGDPRLNIPISVSISGSVDTAALKAAFGDLLQGWTILRTIFPEMPGIGPGRTLPCEQVPALEFTSTAPIGLASLLKEAERHVFDLRFEPPIAATLYEIAPNKYALSIVIHRIAMDSWFVDSFLRDLSSAYMARLQGRSRECIGPPAARSETLPMARRSWPGARLPTTGRRSFQLTARPLRINPGLHKRILKIAGTGQVSTFTAIHAAFAWALGGILRSPEVVIGTCRPGGILLALQTDASTNPPFVEFLRHAGDVLNTAGALLPDDSGLPYDVSLSVVSRKDQPQPPHFSEASVAIAPIAFSYGPARIAVSLIEQLSPEDRPEGIDGTIEFDTTVAASIVEKIVASFSSVLECELQKLDSGSRDVKLSRGVSRMNTMNLRPCNTLQHLLTTEWEDLLQIANVGVLDDFAELGGSPYQRREMLHRVRRLCGLKSLVDDSLAPLTVRSLALTILRQLSMTPEVLEVEKGDRAHQIPLYFLHGDFSGGGYYARKISRCLGPEYPFYLMHPHGLNGCEIPESIELMARAHLTRLRNFQPRGSLSLCGFCGDALVAFEMARVLHSEGQPVHRLILIEPPVYWKTTPRLPTISTTAPVGWMDRPEVRGAWLFGKHAGPVSCYVPSLYEGKVSLFYASGRRSTIGAHVAGSDAQREWNRIAPAAEFFFLPGDHVECVSRYGYQFAIELRNTLA